MAAFNGFSAPVPGQSLTTKPGNAPWEHPPKFTKIDDATNYIFNQLLVPANLHQLLDFMKEGTSLEALARIIIFSGFSHGFWTPDLGMMLSRPIMYILSGFAKRAGIKTKLTHVDRSGLKELVGMRKQRMSIMQPGSMEPPKSLQIALTALVGGPQKGPKGIMAPNNEGQS